MYDKDISSVIEENFGFSAKREQIEALQILQTRDVILIAKTGFGKSLLFHAVPLMYESTKIVLIIMPLIALEDEQCEKINRVPGCRALVLKGDNNHEQIRGQIRLLKYTHSMIAHAPSLTCSSIDSGSLDKPRDRNLKRVSDGCPEGSIICCKCLPSCN